MTRRPNGESELAALLKGQLALSEYLVLQAFVLTDWRTGEDRKIGIYIKPATMRAHPARIAIEVADRQRPVTSTWIESVAQKHAGLPIDLSIVVSRSGFYNPAIRKAAALNIEALALKDAEALNWWIKITSTPCDHTKLFLTPSITEVTVLFTEEESLPEMQDCDLSNLWVYRPSGARRESLLSILEKFLVSEDESIRAFHGKGTHAATSVKAELRLEKGSYVLGSGGERHLVSGIALQATCKRELDAAQLSQPRYDGVTGYSIHGYDFPFGLPDFTDTSGTPDESPCADIH